jgi:hypothetical protein
MCFGLAGCVWLSALSTQWSENFALETYGTEANHPFINDGKLDTVAMVGGGNMPRVFTLKFPDVQKVRRIIIHNDNLFWFHVDYFDTETSEWETCYSMRQRRNIGNQRTQPQYLVDRLNVETNMIRIDVSRTVDDDVVPKPIAEPGDKVVNRKLTVGRLYMPHYRVIAQAPARIREIEVYQLAER